MKSPQLFQLLYQFEIRQIFSPVIMPKIPRDIVLNIKKYSRVCYKKDFSVFERKNQFGETKEI